MVFSKYIQYYYMQLSTSKLHYDREYHAVRNKTVSEATLCLRCTFAVFEITPYGQRTVCYTRNRDSRLRLRYVTSLKNIRFLWRSL